MELESLNHYHADDAGMFTVSVCLNVHIFWSEVYGSDDYD